MDTSEIKVPLTSVTSQYTMHIKVTGMRRWRFRMWCATRLIHLAALIAPVGMNVEVNDRER